MTNKARVELRVSNGEPMVTVRVPKGTTLGDIAKIQESLFANPERLGDKFGRLIRGCPNCLSGLRIEFGEERINPAVHDIQDMFTNLMTEVRSISSRLAAVERGPAAAKLEADVAVGEIAF